MKQKLSILVTVLALLAVALMPAAAFAAQSDFYGEWEASEWVAVDDWWEGSVSVSATEISFQDEGDDSGTLYSADLVCSGLVWGAEFGPGGWGGDLGIQASGTILSVSGDYFLSTLGMTVGGSCDIEMDLSDEGNTLTIQFGTGGAYTGGYIFSRVESGEEPGEPGESSEPGEEVEDEENPKTSDIDVGFIVMASALAVAGIVAAVLGLKKSDTKR